MKINFIYWSIAIALILPGSLFCQDTANGIIWYPPIQLSNSLYDGNHPEISLSGDDTIHITWYYGQYEYITLPYIRSITGGASFEGERELLPDTIVAPYQAVRAKILVQNKDLFIFFTGVNGYPTSITPIHMVTSTDGGDTWSDMRDIISELSACVTSASIIGDTIALIYMAHEDICIKIGRSTNLGLTWTAVNKALNPDTAWSDYNSIRLTPGRMHMIENREEGVTAEISYRWSTNLGTTWSNKAIISTIDYYYSDIPTIAAYQSECGTELLTAWRDTKYGWYGFYGASIISKTSLDGGNSWLPEIILTTQPNGTLPSASINGNVRGITWWKEKNDTMWVAIRGSNSAQNIFFPEVDLTPGAYTGSCPKIIVSKKAIHIVWEELVENTFRAFYRRGEFIQKDVSFSLSTGFMEIDTTELTRTLTDTVRIYNTGSDPLIIGTAISHDSNFTVTPESTTVSPFSSVLFTVHFTPETYGEKTGKVIFYHNGQSSPDCFDVQGFGTWYRDTISYPINEWNMVSIPIKPGPLQALPQLFSFEGTYIKQDSMICGKGYWAKPGEGLITYLGYPTSAETIAVRQGWNMLGSLTEPIGIATRVITIPDSLIITPFYHFDGSGYVEADSIQPGRAYWVKMKMEGTVIIQSDPEKKRR